MAKKRTTIRTAGPDDSIYTSGKPWGTMTTMGAVLRQLRAQGYKRSPEMQAKIDASRKKLVIGKKRSPSR